MKWTHNRFLLLPYVVLLTVLAVVGCSSKQDPSETLPICGNHSCGELKMVTTDTSSDGFHYLNPSMSPDGTKILFTADWWAFPSDPKFEGDDAFTNNRQMIIIENQAGVAPTLDLESQGAELVVLVGSTVRFGPSGNPFMDALITDDKATPVWVSNDTVVASIRDVNIGNQYRLFRVDISTPSASRVEVLFMEPADETTSPLHTQHMEGNLSADGRWLAFTRFTCIRPDSFRTCTGTALWVLDMQTAGDGDGYDAVAFPVTNEYSRLETPRWSADGNTILFSGGMDVAGSGTGAGTEIFSLEFDQTAAATGTATLDNGLNRLTFTTRAPGDPISGILNSSAVYSNDGQTIYFVSTRRAPSITLHDRNIWSIPADGSLDPEIYYFTRADDTDPTVLDDGSILLTSALGFPTEMLNRLENEAYIRIARDDTLNLDEVQLREAAAEERLQLEFFEGVMSHIYIYHP